MKIELCEDNGFLNDGKPTLVVLVVTFKDGKQVRIPYHADRTIQQLYEDVGQMGAKPSDPLPDFKEHSFFETKPVLTPVLKKELIEREDIVRAVKIETDIDGNEPEGREFEVGKEYRIVDIYKKNGVLTHYEVLDDRAGDMIRIPCFPSEIEFVRKRKPSNPKDLDFVEVEQRCPHCQKKTPVMRKAGVLSGQCVECNEPIYIEAPSDKAVTNA